MSEKEWERRERWLTDLFLELWISTGKFIVDIAG